MKKQLISFILIITLFSISIYAVNAQGFSAGAKIGMGLSTLSNWDYRSSGSDENERSPLAGLQASLIGKYKFSDLLGLQAELQYIRKGEVQKYAANTDSEFENMTAIDYLTLPILVNFSHSFDKILVYGNIGPYFGLGVSAKSVMLTDQGSTKKLKFTEGELKRFDMGLCIGAGVGYRLGPGDILLDLRYDLGFMDIYSTPDANKGTNYKATCNRTFGISVGYIIPLGQQ